MAGKQSTDAQQTGSPNMDLKSTSKSPQHGTSIRAVAWRDDGNDSTCDNNGYHERITISSMKRNSG